jgi:predicted PurR-regulated permease PerM
MAAHRNGWAHAGCACPCPAIQERRRIRRIVRGMAAEMPSTRVILRTVLIIVSVVLILYVIYLVRRPLSWLVIATFLAVAMSGPVNLLQRRMKRGLAIAVAYATLILIPIGVGAALVPPLVNQAEDLAGNAPQYAQDVTDFVNKNQTLSELNDKYDITGEIENAAQDLPSKIGDAAGILRDIGVGVVNSVFAGVTILILSIFMVAGGRRWIEAFLRSQPPDRAARMRRALEHMAQAIANYVGGALLQATLAGIAAFVMLTILGAPFAGPLALIVFFFDLIPVVGATIAAVLVAVVMLFVNFPTGLIIWVVFAIVYQQVENYLIQPRIQARATEIEPFVIIVSVLFGSTLFGVIGAVLAIPTAATIQIGAREYAAYRRETREATSTATPTTTDGPAEAPA